MALQFLTDANPKLMKGSRYGWFNIGLMLAPGKLSGKNVCPYASPGCLRACTNTSGQGGFVKGKSPEEVASSKKNSVVLARIRRTQLLLKEPEKFWFLVIEDIARAMNYCERRDRKLCIRMNCTSDILWERLPVRYLKEDYPNIFKMFPEVQFYDYTKIPSEYRRNLPANYHLTYSFNEDPKAGERSAAYFSRGCNTALVFDVPGRPSSQEQLPIPLEWQGRKVIDGSENDLRFEDPQGCYVGLRALGWAKKIAFNRDRGHEFIIESGLPHGLKSLKKNPRRFQLTAADLDPSMPDETGLFPDITEKSDV